MDTENSFDSDTSESWSLIDINGERPLDINLTDEIGVEVFETKPEEILITEKCSSLPGAQGENGLPEDITRSVEDVESTYDHLKNQPDFQILYKTKIYEDDCDLGIKPEAKCSKSNLDVDENIDPKTKDLDEDTDGISVISESEYNDVKVTAYESDEVWDEKPSDSDANENPTNILPMNNKVLSCGESSEENMNSEMVAEKTFCPKSITLEKRGNRMGRKQQRTTHVYRRNRNNFGNFVFSVTMGILFTGVAFITFGQFLGVQDSQEAASQMAQALRKLQKENVLLHSRLTQLSRAILARGVNKLDLKEETENSCLKDDNDCRKANLKFSEHDIDKGNYDLSYPRHKDSLDFSIPLNHPKNVLAFKQILGGNEVLARESTEPVEPFNFSKYVDALVRGQFAMGSISKPEGIVGRVIKLMEPEKEKKLEPHHNEPDKKNEKPEDKNCQTADSTSQDDEIQRQNCLAIREKDLSQFRWYILKDKPKCPEIKEREMEGLGTESFYGLPMDREDSKKNPDEPDDSNAVTTKTNVLKEKDNELELTPDERSVGFSFLDRSIHDSDKPKEMKPSNKDLQFKKTKKDDLDFNSGGHYFYHGENSAKKKRKNEKDKVEIVYAEKYPKHFPNDEANFKKNKGKMRECGKGENGRCEFRLKKKNENYHVQKENYKENMEKRPKPGGERKDKKKDQLPNLNKNRYDLRSKKCKTCSIKSASKCENESSCEHCACKSGDWFSKWAEGRAKCRRDQKISDWQFDRAKSREYSRLGDAFWQFSRAYGRQSRRMYPYSRKRKVKYFSRKGFGFKI